VSNPALLRNAMTVAPPTWYFLANGLMPIGVFRYAHNIIMPLSPMPFDGSWHWSATDRSFLDLSHKWKSPKTFPATSFINLIFF
jgi:hypothetical protein